MDKTRSNNKISILIVGATGQLGSLITSHALKTPNLLVNILVRDPKKSPELVKQVEEAGGRVVVGDLAAPHTLKGSTQGIHTIISAISSYDEKTVVDGQIALIDDAVANGVKRFVPSEFGVNYYKFSREEASRFVLVKYKLQVHDYLDKTKLQKLTFSQGFFIETLFLFFGSNFSYWGDADYAHDFTTYDDVARFAVAGVAQENRTGFYAYVGDSLTFDQVTQIYNRVRGTNVTAKRSGSLEELKKLYDEKVAAGDFQSAGKLGMALVIFDKRAKFDKRDNAEFGEVTSTSMEEFIRKHPEAKIGG